MSATKSNPHFLRGVVSEWLVQGLVECMNGLEIFFGDTCLPGANPLVKKLLAKLDVVAVVRSVVALFLHHWDGMIAEKQEEAEEEEDGENLKN